MLKSGALNLGNIWHQENSQMWLLGLLKNLSDTIGQIILSFVIYCSFFEFFWRNI